MEGVQNGLEGRRGRERTRAGTEGGEVIGNKERRKGREGMEGMMKKGE